MARRIASFTASAGRDAGKVFRITEMPADQAERWAVKAFWRLPRAALRCLIRRQKAALQVLRRLVLPCFQICRPSLPLNCLMK